MNKPWVIWSFSALIALLVFGAMAAITQHTLGLEKERAMAEAKAELEGRIRIALWRMDTAASGILAEENNRPSWHFRDVDLNKRTQLSPLNLDVPENVKLHFEVKPGGAVSTPQINDWTVIGPAPDWSNRQSQIQQGMSLSKQKLTDWKRLMHLLTGDTTFSGWQNTRNVFTSLADNNLGMICAVAQRGSDDWKVDQSVWDAKVAVAQQQRLASAPNDIRNSKDYQGNYNVAEKAKRTEIVKKSSTNRMQGKNKGGDTKEPAQAESFTKPAASKEPPSGKQAEPGPADQSAYDHKIPAPAGQEKYPGAGPLAKPGVVVEDVDETHLSSLTPVWIGDDIILVREVKDASGIRTQGVWLDTGAVRKLLIDNITDLLPDARLEPVRHSLKVLLGEKSAPDADDPMVMAALPWRLLPGEVVAVQPAGWTPMRKTLAVAWVGALLAALAAVVLMRGVVKLSERRASFVSSVTHELRTPLTTFSLYSDMLAEGMVQDEAKQKDYLQTLRKESARLTHLVENVLAYSRIERGSARARIETVRVGELVDRMCERLRTRADEAGMKLHCAIEPDVAGREIKVDTTAVEQIIFNLVDNASKYAGGEGDDMGIKVIEIRAVDRGKVIVLQVCDEGPGIDKGERRKLFKAFHKSAMEAAHTKPGVGLGLALSRRLARALGGDLRIVDSEKGACFELIIDASL
ncbi:MAG: hypothetical protein H7A51_08805 [Akkermansiaceae bacterium]|nr:hypothetical protein [Akkermansiaceae bacterium]